MNWTKYANFCFPMPRKTCLKFELNWPSVSREDPDVYVHITYSKL